MKRFIILGAIFLFSFLTASCQDVIKERGKQDDNAQKVTYQEPNRPQFHFTPVKNWTNDPNGLVYYNGKYHLFYQHNPFGITWGHMSWGHAVSTDLVHWEHLPVALEEEHNIMIFSGSAVVDINNTSGLGTKKNPPMVAIYTGHHTNKKLEEQSIAYSLDNGRSWTKYKGNPVIDEGMSNFRDPKVFWHESTEKWIMAVALPTQQKIRFYGSGNLKDWKKLSEFGPAGAAGDILWECPDLFKLPVIGKPGKTKWVLIVSVNPGGVAGGSGVQYFVGQFNGTRFVQDPQTKGQTLWADYGRDFYAVQSYNNIPEEDGRRIWIAWMNNWDYASKIPTSPWRGAMTIPRKVQLIATEQGPRLIQKPIKELQTLRGDHFTLSNVTIGEGESIKPEFEGTTFELIAKFKIKDAQSFGIKVRQGKNEETVVGYNVDKQVLFVDRTRSGTDRFNSTFEGRQTGPLVPKNGIIKLHLYVDASSIEVFGNGGRLSITDLIFPSESSDGIEIYSRGGSAKLISLDIWDIKSIWKNKKN